jgi:hypothetical protein
MHVWQRSGSPPWVSSLIVANARAQDLALKGTNEPRPPATNPSSPTARRSSRPAASPSATVSSPSRITRTQQGNPMLRTPLDPRCVLRPSTYGLHEDHTPSLQLYERDWYCYGACRTGGSIYDLGALLYGLGTRGQDFLKLRRRLADDLGLVGPRAPGRPVHAKRGMIAAASVRCCRSR